MIPVLRRCCTKNYHNFSNRPLQKTVNWHSDFFTLKATMDKIKILWVDDEIDLLKPHILFLEKKNYEVTTCNNGLDAIAIFESDNFDIVFLDENMPGMSGLETLSEMKEKKSSVPMIMITKSEEEYIMEEAIGSKIADYLIKPVNPNQILLSLKKNLDHSRLVSQKTTLDYQKEFRKITMEMAQQLIGVTMQESGVSRIVEVDMDAAVQMMQAFESA